MAQVQLTDITRAELIADPNFQAACQQACMDQAVYTRGVDGVGLPNAAAAQQWCLWRPFAAAILDQGGTPVYSDPQIATIFAYNISKRGLSCWDSVAGTTAAAIAWLTSNNHFGANDLAQDWFSSKTYRNFF
jgi:hypothetical protein